MGLSHMIEEKQCSVAINGNSKAAGTVIGEWIARLGDSRTSYDVFKILRDIVLHTNFEQFIVARLPKEEDRRLADVTILTNWSPELIRFYDHMELLRDSVCFELLRNSSLPYSYDISSSIFPQGEDYGREVRRLFDRFDHRGGICFGVSNAAGQRGMIGFAGDRPPLDPETEALLSLMAIHVYERLSQLDMIAVNRMERVLTERERECIRWTAAGKTSAEAAEIMGISTNTVNHYLTAASVKLGTMNKAHTVARALQMGAI